ncbi:ABC transporter substrate-binding protein [Streptomyces sp.]|uniref:ABC transporter substrate-binding protein n=1 Tax=Streptomyces sp. TaxID=1931 RepID=UPI00281211F6|nr:ABC transporter substrate-binding protein [Streptomyces sp.]
MSGTRAAGWEWTDDRGAVAVAARPPRRVLAYVRAGAALLDLGVTPVAVYGSGHDGALPDPAKAGGLAAAGVPYTGAGRDLDEERLRELEVELVVDVTYDGKSPYALDEALAGRLGVPLVTLAVGDELTLPAILDRFADLAAHLDAPGAAARPTPQGAGLPGAEAALRTAAAGSGARVLALSGAGPDQVHLARPQAWPELVRLAGLGVRLLDPGPGPGTSWLTTDWRRVAELGADLVLFDHRAHAVPPQELPGVLPPAVRLVPWSPELPPSPAACARFFGELAEALQAPGRR